MHALNYKELNPMLEAITTENLSRRIVRPYNGSKTAPRLGRWKFSFEKKRLWLCPDARRMLGLSTPDLSIGGALKLFPAHEVPVILRAFKTAIVQMGHFSVDFHFLQGQHKQRLLLNGVCSFKKWGKIDGIAGTVEDISQKMAEENLGLSIVGHELKSPLSIIKLNTALTIKLLQGKKNNQLINLLNIVDEHANGITRILDEYLTTSLSPNRLPELRCCTIDLTRLLEQVLGEIKMLHPCRKFRFSAARDLWVKADKYKIVQVISNYMMNAVKFSPLGTLIDIEAEQCGGFIIVAVSDRGTGIEEGTEKLIFQRNYSTQKSPEHHRYSKGLGLYLAEQIIAAHGGKVRATRREGGGSVFYFSLPELPA